MNANRSKQIRVGRWWVFLLDASGWRFAPLGLNGTIDIGTPRIPQYKWIRDDRVNGDDAMGDAHSTSWLELALLHPMLSRPRLYKSVKRG